MSSPEDDDDHALERSYVENLEQIGYTNVTFNWVEHKTYGEMELLYRGTLLGKRFFGDYNTLYYLRSARSGGSWRPDF